jgi:hypothetical protein
MPVVSIDAMNQHLAEISKCVSVSAIALLILDGAGWHSSPQLILPENIVLMPLPSYAPELNSVENIWAPRKIGTSLHRANQIQVSHALSAGGWHGTAWLLRFEPTL